MLFNETKKAALESILFVSVDAIGIDRLCKVLDLSQEDVSGLLEELREEYDKNHHGIRIIHVAEGYRFVTKDDYADEVEAILQPHISKMSRASLETLSIIAYRQPIIRAEIERIRGVGVDRILARLMEENLIYELGRKPSPGRPILYGTSQAFLEYFGLKSLEDLPPLKEVSEEEIADELAALGQKQESLEQE